MGSLVESLTLCSRASGLSLRKWGVGLSQALQETSALAFQRLCFFAWGRGGAHRALPAPLLQPRVSGPTQPRPCLFSTAEDQPGCNIVYPVENAALPLVAGVFSWPPGVTGSGFSRAF